MIKRILIHSNGPHVPTGYGNQVAAFAPLLRDAGYEVYISCFYGLEGAQLTMKGINLLPKGRDGYGNDIVGEHAKRYEVDLIWTLIDAWVLQGDWLQQHSTACWAPIDHEPIPAQVAEALKACRWPVAYSRFGEQQMKAAGLNASYVPHGINTEFYCPQDRADARQKWGVDEQAFFAVMVAANKGVPARKSLDRVIKAWATFAPAHPGAVLYMHSLPLPLNSGLNLVEMARFYGCEDSLRFPDTARMLAGEYSERALLDLYNAADVLLAPSMGEGFNIPLVEAQACGCPVIATDFTAHRELIFGGYRLPVEWQDRVWTFQDSEQCQVKPSAIVTGLEWAFEHRGDVALRVAARAGAVEYDARNVFTEYMQPLLKRIGEEVEADRARTHSE